MSGPPSSQLFMGFLTSAAPTANYRGESEQNRSVLQKIAIGEHEFPVISPEAIRFALREMLRGYGLPCNRRRERNEPQLSVSYDDYPNPDRFVDDFYFGYMVVNREQIPKSIAATFQYKRESILRTNLAVALSPYRYESLLSQSPLNVGRDEDKPKWANSNSSALLEREHLHTRFQFPVALCLDDCQLEPSTPWQPRNLWFASLLRALSELSGVAGNQSRSLFAMEPVSAVARLTPRLAPGFSLYPYQSDGQVPELLEALLQGDLPGNEHHLAGELTRALAPPIAGKLKRKGVHLHRTVEAMLNEISQSRCGLPLR
jgi:CRISPR-associated protein Cst2